MDLETLTKETILKNMTPEQQQAVLESVMASVQESKKVRSQKVAENVDLVLEALKKIEGKMLERVSQAASKVETVASSVKDGRDGKDGKNGKDGKDGAVGPKGADGRPGKDGKDGKDGRDGVDGVSVVNAFLDFDNSLIIELSNGRQINVGAILSGDTADKVKVVSNGGGTSQYVIDAINALQAEIDAIAIPSQTGNAGKFLGTTGTALQWQDFPDLTITDTFVVNSQAAMLALTAQKGDVAVRTDLNKTFILTASPASTLANWQELLTPTDLVLSVNSKTGAVVLSTTDIGEGTNQYFTTTRARGAVSAGTGISYDSGTGVITNSAPDQTVVLTQGGTTSITGTYPNFTISSSDQYVGTVTSVAALTLGTTGTDVSSSVATGTTTPVITLNIPTASSTNRGALSSTDWSTFNGKQAALVSGTNIKTVNSTSLLGSGDLAVGTVTSVGGTGTVSGLTLTGTVTTTGSLTLGGTLSVTPSNFDSQTANYVLAAPNGTAGTPTFRALVAADIPTLNQNTTGSAGSLATTNFSIVESGGKLLIKYGSTTIASISSTGVITSAVNIVSNGTP